MVPACVEPRGRDGQAPVASTAHPGSNLAALLDRFTGAITNPANETIGNFAGTVDALHRELAMLARHFGAEVEAAPEALDLDDIFPDVTSIDAGEPYSAAIAPASTGAADAEELEHLCGELSQG